MKPSRGESGDKYEQMLERYDWHSTRPPRNYVYGVGRGARAFVTSGELTGGLALSTIGKPTREENDFFSALDRIEERGKRPAAQERRRAATGDGAAASGAGAASASAPVKLSMEDLAAFDGLGVSAVTAGDAAAAATAAAAAARMGLTTRSARSEAAEGAEEYFFSDERGITMNELLRNKSSATQHGLQNLLEMGSPDEQGTWVTHARALREMGMARRAYQTLKEGCARTGRQGSMIWEERLAYLPADDAAARRRVLEEATAACPATERLWMQLLDHQLPHERTATLQRAVIECPTGEQLWLQVVAMVPAVADQKSILAQALKRTPDLPLLWAKLARLETAAERGKRVFAAAAQRFPSLTLVVEAAKYVEWWGSRRRGVAGAPQRLSPSVHAELDSTVRTAAAQYLDAADPTSRARWVALAAEVCSYGNKGDDDGNGDTPTAAAAASGAGERRPRPLAQQLRYVWTAAHMFFHFLRPKTASGAFAVPATWLEDLLAAVEGPCSQRHGTLCALWATWLLLVRHEQQQQMLAAPSGRRSHGGGGEAADGGWLSQVLDVISDCIATAPDTSLDEVIATVLAAAHAHLSPGGDADSRGLLDVKVEPGTGPRKASHAAGEEEEEELAPRRRVQPSPHSATLLVKKEEAADDDGVPPADTKGAFAAADAAAEAQAMPSPLAAVMAETIAAGEGETEREGDGAVHTAPSNSLSLALTVAKALFNRRRHRAALNTLLLAQGRLASATSGDARRLVVAIAKCHAALGQSAAADRCLDAALRAAVDSSGGSAGGDGEDLLWLKLAVHRRSGAAPASAEELETLLAAATQRCPQSERLWLMRLENARGRAAAALTGPSPPTPADGAPPTAAAVAQSHIRELRRLYEEALRPAHCRAVPAVWTFAALRIEAELLHAAAAARALLLDAVVACGAVGGRVPGAAAGSRSDALQRQSRAAAAIGVARARVELLHAGPSQALEVVKETLQALPKTREGAFLAPAGELLQLVVDLEVPALRGRAAAQVMRQWRSQEPLALLAVAKLYHAAGQHDKALEQAVKAATIGAAGGGANDCGDCAALLYKLAVQRPELSRAVGARVGLKPEELGDTAADAPPPPLPPNAARRWVASVLAGRPMPAVVGSSGSDDADCAAAFEELRFRSGPLWLSVAKAADPANVTLLGYRDSVEDMLRRTADLIAL